VLLLAVGCSTDPHAVVISASSKENFTTLVSVVGKTIADVVADQQKWRKDRDQLSKDLEPLYRSAKAIQAATGVGVSYLKYSELVQAFATEHTVANDKASTTEADRIVDLFRNALKAYQDAGALWRHQIEFGKYEDMYSGGVGYSIKGHTEPELVRIVEEYKIPIRDGKLKYSQGAYQAIPKNSMQAVWPVADKRMNAAVEAYVAK
jgi:hypothetical protein